MKLGLFLYKGGGTFLPSIAMFTTMEPCIYYFYTIKNTNFARVSHLLKYFLTWDLTWFSRKRNLGPRRTTSTISRVKSQTKIRSRRHCLRSSLTSEGPKHVIWSSCVLDHAWTQQRLHKIPSLGVTITETASTAHNCNFSLPFHHTTFLSLANSSRPGAPPSEWQGQGNITTIYLMLIVSVSCC